MFRGAGVDVGNSRRPTFIRLNMTGELAWIDQVGDCRTSFGSPSPPLLNGLYESSTLRQVAPSNGAKLANQRYGRRVITNRGQALTFAGLHLQWPRTARPPPLPHLTCPFHTCHTPPAAHTP